VLAVYKTIYKVQRNDYTITKKGMVTVEKIKEIVGTEARVPRITMSFE